MFGTTYTLGYLILTFVILVLGIITHFLKKKIQGENLDDIVTYFKSHFKNTVATIIAACVAYGSLVATTGLSIIASFTIGYAADSLFNRADGDVPGNIKDNGLNG